MTDGFIDNLSPLVYFREFEKNYYKCHYHCLLTDRITNGLFDSYVSNSLKKISMDKKIIDVMT